MRKPTLEDILKVTLIGTVASITVVTVVLGILTFLVIINYITR